MAKATSHKLLWVAGVGVGGFLAYRYVYQPWKASQDALLTANTLPNPLAPTPLISYPTYNTGLPATALPNPLSMLTQPNPLAPVPSIGPQYTGVLGACIAKKGGTWSATQCQTRLNDLVAAAQRAQAAIAQLRSGAANPASAGIPAAQAQLAAEQAALMNANTAYNNALAAGDANGAATWHAAMLAHTADINDLNARIAAASQPVDNSAAIAAYQGALAANDNDYFNLTGVHLLSQV